MQRQSSTASSMQALLLDTGKDDHDDLDSCFSDSDVFDPPAWRPGRFLQFADIDLTTEDEPSVRPVSLSTERPLGHHRPSGLSGVEVVGERFETTRSGLSFPGSFVVQVDSERLACLRHGNPLVSRRTLLLVTSCTAVALTALTLLSFVLF